MTAPIIPADQWPEWADRHCWDEDGRGYFWGVNQHRGEWCAGSDASGIPMPTGWDWRVPVMRPQKDTDLGQFRPAVERAMHASITAGFEDYCRNLLALIDGQAKPKRGPDRPDLCEICDTREETRADAEGIPFCDKCWNEVFGWEQPAKGEGE